MNRKVGNLIARYAFTLGVVAAISIFYRFVYRHANATTVGFTFLVAVLLVSASWGFQPALFLTVLSAAAFDFFFLPPFGTFSVADPQNWVALLSFLLASLIAAHLANRARTQADQAKRRRGEVERLYAFSQQLLTSDNVVRLLNRVPAQINETFGVGAAALMLAGKKFGWKQRRPAVY